MKKLKQQTAEAKDVAQESTEQLVERSHVTVSKLRRGFANVLNEARDGELFDVSSHGNLVAQLGPADAVETVRSLSRTAVLQELTEFIPGLQEDGPALVLDERKPDSPGVSFAAPSAHEVRAFREEVLAGRRAALKASWSKANKKRSRRLAAISDLTDEQLEQIKKKIIGT